MKDDFTIEELEQMLTKKKKEEADRIKAEEEKKAKELELAKEARTREIREKEDELRELLTAYLEDYGSYSATRSESGYPSIWHWFY